MGGNSSSDYCSNPNCSEEFSHYGTRCADMPAKRAAQQAEMQKRIDKLDKLKAKALSKLTKAEREALGY